MLDKLIELFLVTGTITLLLLIPIIVLFTGVWLSYKLLDWLEKRK